MSAMVIAQREDGPIAINPDRIAFIVPDGDRTFITLDDGNHVEIHKEFAKVVQMINSARRQ